MAFLPSIISPRNSARTACVVAALLFSMPAFAYVGPGAGLSAIGTIIALVAAFLLAIVGFIWYPVKRMLRKRKTQTGDSGTPED